MNVDVVELVEAVAVDDSEGHGPERAPRTKAIERDAVEKTRAVREARERVRRRGDPQARHAVRDDGQEDRREDQEGGADDLELVPGGQDPEVQSDVVERRAEDEQEPDEHGPRIGRAVAPFPDEKDRDVASEESDHHVPRGEQPVQVIDARPHEAWDRAESLERE